MKAEAVFEILVREHSDMLWGYLSSTIYDKSAAEDIFQEALVVAWRRLDDYDRERPFSAWLRGIASKLILAYLRKTGRKGVALADEESLEMMGAHYDQFESRPSDQWTDKLDALQRCMGELNETDKRIIDCHYYDDQDCRAIASLVGMGVEAVKKRIQRARAALAACIEKTISAEVPQGSRGTGLAEDPA